MILITGGGGGLGSNLARYLLDMGERVLVLFHRPSRVPSFLAPFWDDQAKGVVGDIMDLPHLCSMIKEYSVESIIHCAVMLEKTPYQMTTVNIIGTTNVLEAGRIFGLRRVTFISSETVYFGTKADTYHESLDLRVAYDIGAGYPIGMIKRACEDICAFYAREYGLSVPIVRPGRIYGPGCIAGRLPLEAMIQNAVAHKLTDLPHIYGGSEHAWINVKDCAKGVSLVHLVKALGHNIYNLGDGAAHTLSDFAQAIRDVIPDAEIRLGGTMSDRDIDRPPLDISRIKAEGFAPDYDLKQGVSDYIDWVREGKY